MNLDAARDQARAALRRVFDACGGQKAFADKLNERLTKLGQQTITRQAVNWWISEGVFVDARYWPYIEEFSDMASTRRHLRPDLYGMGAGGP